MPTEFFLNIMVKPVIWPNILFITSKISRQVNLLRRQSSSSWNYCDSSVLKNTSESQIQEANLEIVVIKMILSLSVGSSGHLKLSLERAGGPTFITTMCTGYIKPIIVEV